MVCTRSPWGILKTPIVVRKEGKYWNNRPPLKYPTGTIDHMVVPGHPERSGTIQIAPLPFKSTIKGHSTYGTACCMQNSLPGGPYYELESNYTSTVECIIYQSLRENSIHCTVCRMAFYCPFNLITCTTRLDLIMMASY